MQIPQNGNHYICGKSDILAIMIAFRFLLNKNEFLTFKRALTKIITDFEKKSNSEKKKKLLFAMGFPQNWSSIARYKI